MSSPKTRPYSMKRRAEQVDETRQRITEAAVRLHTTVGPSNTSIASVAEEASVTRVTVYRHFATLDDLFVACTAHWRTLNPPPDAAAWLDIEDLETRATRAFSDLYAWYRDHADDLYPINRDTDAMPASARQAAIDRNAFLVAAILADRAAPGSSGDPRERRLRAVAGHLTVFMTWHSLAVAQGLPAGADVDVAVRTLMAMA
jgi:AcrR family transcriptional regulator